MIQLTAEAQHMLDEYLRQAELHLRGARTADAEEVTCDLQERLDTVPDARKLGPQRWLLYPSLILVYIPLAFLLFLWPPAPLLILPWHTILPSLLTQTWECHLPY